MNETGTTQSQRIAAAHTALIRNAIAVRDARRLDAIDAAIELDAADARINANYATARELDAADRMGS